MSQQCAVYRQQILRVSWRPLQQQPAESNLLVDIDDDLWKLNRVNFFQEPVSGSVEQSIFIQGVQFLHVKTTLINHQ